jgi:hypothetical protein
MEEDPETTTISDLVPLMANPENATEEDKQWGLNNVPALEHNYRSKIPPSLPYPYHLALEPKAFYEEKQKLAVRIPGKEQFT